MDGNKVLEVIGIYRSFFEKSGIPKKDFPHNQLTNTDENVLAHCHGMLDEMEQFVVKGRMEKVFRWLGFIQGCLWSTGYFTLDELKNHNRPDSTLKAD